MTEFTKLDYHLLKKTPIDIYVKIGQKVIPLKNLSTDQDYLNQFIEKNRENPDFFYIKTNDLETLLKQNSTKILQVGSLEECVEVLDCTASLMFQSFKNNSVSTSSINTGYDLIKGTLTGNTKQYLNKVIENLSNNSSVANQSLMRSLICYYIAQSLGWQRETNYQNLITGSILADIGNILDPNEPHPYNSVKFLGPFANNSDVKKIVEHHHENFDGSGLLGLVKAQIHPLSKIVRVADEIIKRNHPTILENVQDVFNESKNLYDKDCLVPLMDFLRLKKIS